jgi:alkaline phosphatase D
MSSPIPRRRFLAGLPALGLVPAIAAAPGSEPLRHVLFGSCLNTHEHPMLDRTLTLPRDLFIFMGDNIYADKGGLPMMRDKYALLKQSRFFQGLRAKGNVVATWDDHDFGLNDGGADYADRKQAQLEFWNWLDEPLDSPRRAKEGVYDVQMFGPRGQRVQVITLDTRYFRSPLKRVPKEQALVGGPYVANEDASTTMLGDAQWQWLEAMLQQPAEVRLIVSSVQFAADVHGGECWANMPHERKRMMDVLRRTRANGVLILSGDRHWCEFSRLDDVAGYPLYDLTSSSMTQVHPRGTPTANAHRSLQKTHHVPNVGHLEIDWKGADTTIAARIVDVDGKAPIEHRIKLSELRTV